MKPDRLYTYRIRVSKIHFKNIVFELKLSQALDVLLFGDLSIVYV